MKVTTRQNNENQTKKKICLLCRSSSVRSFLCFLRQSISHNGHPCSQNLTLREIIERNMQFGKFDQVEFLNDL